MMCSPLRACCYLLLSVFTSFPSVGLGQGLEKAAGVEIAPVLHMPTGDWADAFGIGGGGEVMLFRTLPSRQIITITAGVLAPTPDYTGFSFLEFPITLSLLFPLALENASTPYFGLGPSYVITSAKAEGQDAENRGRIGYHLAGGYLFAPEHWRSTFLDLKLRYVQFFVGDAPDMRSVDLLAGIGLKM